MQWCKYTKEILASIFTKEIFQLHKGNRSFHFLKGHVNPKIHFFPILRNKWHRKRICYSFCPIRLISGRKLTFLTEIPLLVKTIARSRDISGWINVLRNTYSTAELVGRTARTSGRSSDNVFSEECDSNAWATSLKYEPCRVHRNHPHEDSTEPVVIGADRLRNSDWYLIYCAIYYYLAWKSDKARVQSAAVRHR